MVACDQGDADKGMGAAPGTQALHPGAALRCGTVDKIAQYDETFRGELADQRIESRKIVFRIATGYGDAGPTEHGTLAKMHVGHQQHALLGPVHRALRM